jgi:tetratricopeptide (TPR) repeat protein
MARPGADRRRGAGGREAGDPRRTPRAEHKPDAGIPREPSRRAAPGFEPAAADRAARAAWVALALLAAARAVLAATPSTWGWSLALLRFLAPVQGWGLWALATATLVPALARPALATVTRLGDALVRAPGRAGAAWAAGGALLAWVLPDRVGFVGDFLLRENTLATEGVAVAQWYPQALPLDLGIHHHLARGLMLATGADAAVAGRLIGAFDVAILGWLAVRFAAGLGLRGAAAFVAASGVFWTGALTLFTGYNKAFAEMTLVIAAVGTCGVRAARTGRGLVPLLLVTAAALTLHRSALGILPAVALACAWALRARGRELLARPSTWIALAAPVLSLAFMVPRILHIVRSVDPIHFTPAEPGRSALASAFAGARPADMLNLIVMLAPLAVVALAALPALGAGVWRRRELLLLSVLALPFVALIPFIHAQQGLFRDWDDFAAAGMGVSLLAAWLLGETLRAAGARAWLALPLCLAAAVPSAQWLVHHTDTERSLARVRAFVAEPPQRTSFERAMTWQYLGMTYLALNRHAEAADAYSHAAELLSSPHILRQWGLAESLAGHHERARGVFRTLHARVPGDVIALRGLMFMSLPLHDSTTARAAAESLLRVSPGDPQASELLRQLERGIGNAPRP